MHVCLWWTLSKRYYLKVHSISCVHRKEADHMPVHVTGVKLIRLPLSVCVCARKVAEQLSNRIAHIYATQNGKCELSWRRTNQCHFL